jgi:hypothetical protein
LNIWNTSYDQKKRQESNWQLDSQPLKVKNRHNFIMCRQLGTYYWALDNGYNFAWNRIAIEGLHAKLCAPKVAGVPLESPRTKSHLDVGPVKRRKVYYKGEGGGFPQVRAMVSLMSPSCPWLVLAPKVLQLCTNHLILVLCKFVWVIEACQFFLIPSWSSNTPLYPFKVLQARERAPTPCSSVIFSLDSHLNPLRSWECVIVDQWIHYFFIGPRSLQPMNSFKI